MKGRSFRSPRCPMCRRPMKELGRATNEGRSTFFCQHGIREVRYLKPRGSVIGRVTRGVEAFAQVVDGRVVARDVYDYGAKQEISRQFFHGWSYVGGVLTGPRV